MQAVGGLEPPPPPSLPPSLAYTTLPAPALLLQWIYCFSNFEPPLPATYSPVAVLLKIMRTQLLRGRDSRLYYTPYAVKVVLD
jgi:hypothetical protein